MTEGPLHPVWETLPAEHQRSLLLALGRMAMRQIRVASTTQQLTIGEIADDHRREPRGCVRENRPPAP